MVIGVGKTGNGLHSAEKQMKLRAGSLPPHLAFQFSGLELDGRMAVLPWRIIGKEKKVETILTGANFVDKGILYPLLLPENFVVKIEKLVTTAKEGKSVQLKVIAGYEGPNGYVCGVAVLGYEHMVIGYVVMPGRESRKEQTIEIYPTEKDPKKAMIDAAVRGKLAFLAESPSPAVAAKPEKPALFSFSASNKWDETYGIECWSTYVDGIKKYMIKQFNPDGRPMAVEPFPDPSFENFIVPQGWASVIDKIDQEYDSGESITLQMHSMDPNERDIYLAHPDLPEFVFGRIEGNKDEFEKGKDIRVIFDEGLREILDQDFLKTYCILGSGWFLKI